MTRMADGALLARRFTVVNREKCDDNGFVTVNLCKAIEVAHGFTVLYKGKRGVRRISFCSPLLSSADGLPVYSG